jgi:hypothetical protein
VYSASKQLAFTHVVVVVVVVVIVVAVVTISFMFLRQTLLLLLLLLLRSFYFACMLLDIVNLGGLPLIVSLCRHFEDDTDVTIKLVKVLSNISMQDGMLQHFFVTGKTSH